MREQISDLGCTIYPEPVRFQLRLAAQADAGLQWMPPGREAMVVRNSLYRSGAPIWQLAPHLAVISLVIASIIGHVDPPFDVRGRRCLYDAD